VEETVRAPGSAPVHGSAHGSAHGPAHPPVPPVSWSYTGDFETFAAERGPALVRLARGLLKDPYLAEDVVQDVLAKALIQWPRVSRADDIDAYVRRMVVNACTSFFRRAARRERSTDQAYVLDGSVADRSADHAERMNMLALLRRLPAKQRAVLVLRHYEGLADSEIAVLLACSEVTVRSNAHRGLAKLRQMLEE
jgi:RNA polymerase sigma-70 factor (sigma-E family)